MDKLKVVQAYDLLQAALSGFAEPQPVRSAGDCLIETIRANVDNSALTDSSFREFIRKSLSTIPKRG